MSLAASFLLVLRVSRLPHFRQQIEDEIEERIAILDRMDGNPDLEPNGDDEPSLGWSRTYAIGGTDDLEEVRA